ncbi:MAG: hypothetical protein R3A44_07805 [Caldilineaceae bacterium]
MLHFERWSVVWQALFARPNRALFEQLATAYAAPNRFYHTQQHLAECLHHFDDARHLMQRPAEVELALWFHDAIYDARRGDNEERSAKWARQAIANAGLDDQIMQRVADLILLTRHDAPPVDADSALLLDIDLAILGAEPTRFAEYEAQIRQEYAWVPWPIYREKRTAVLQSFLDRSSIYHTSHFKEQFELKARINLMNAIQKL